MPNFAAISTGIHDELKQMVAQRLFEQMQQARIQDMEQQRALQSRGLDLGEARTRQDASQFDARLGQDQAELGERTRQFDAQEPQRVAGLKLTEAQTGELQRRPERESAAAAAATAKDERDFEQQKEVVRLNARLRPADKERAVQIMGPEGTPIWVTESQAIGKPAAQAARAVTGQERQTLAYYNRAKEADTLAQQFEDPVAKAGVASQLQQQYAPNMLQTTAQQSYRQAQRAFTEARLRKESGAAIPQGEYENDARTYFAQPGDSPQVREQKRQARQTVLEGLKFSSGKAYNEFYGDDGQKPTASSAPQETKEQRMQRLLKISGGQ